MKPIRKVLCGNLHPAQQEENRHALDKPALLLVVMPGLGTTGGLIGEAHLDSPFPAGWFLALIVLGFNTLAFLTASIFSR